MWRVVGVVVVCFCIPTLSSRDGTLGYELAAIGEPSVEGDVKVERPMPGNGETPSIINGV